MLRTLIIAHFALTITNINAGDSMKNFICFKDYPNVASSKIKQQTLTNKLPEWDLGFLYSNYNDKKIFTDLNRAEKGSLDFKKKYQASLEKESLNSKQILKAIKEYEDIWQEAVLPVGYLSNTYNVNLDNEKLKALNGKAEIIMAKIAKNLSFFENTLARTSDNYKKTVLASKDLDTYRNFINKVSETK